MSLKRKELKRRKRNKMKAALIILFSLVSLLSATDKPNIIIIFTDDMGYSDIGPFGNKKHSTPHLDRMAKEGRKFTAFYVSSSACTPSRSALLTGTYADRIGMGRSVVFPADARGLNTSEITIAEMLKENGYTTGCFGKWHLGDAPEFMPLNQGFDEYEGIPYSNDMWVKGNKKRNFPPLAWMKQDKAIAHIPDNESQTVLQDAITDATVDFIKRHKNQPFFAYVPHAAVHAPHIVSPERLKAAGDDVMKALISEVDNSTGRILETLRELGIDKKTLVIFTNDNGGAGKTTSFPLKGHKFGPKYEGHMRVSTLAWWPENIPAGTVTGEIGASIDILPTIAKITGAKVPSDRIIDGKDYSNVLLGKEGAKSPHETLFYEKDGVRQGKWKLVVYSKREKKGTPPKAFTELYNLDEDIGESNNLADKYPEIVTKLKKLLDSHVKELEANQRPAGTTENPKVLLTHEAAKSLPTLHELRNKK